MAGQVVPRSFFVELPYTSLKVSGVNRSTVLLMVLGMTGTDSVARDRIP